VTERELSRDPDFSDYLEEAQNEQGNEEFENAEGDVDFDHEIEPIDSYDTEDKY
jgi:hypothetical protein